MSVEPPPPDSSRPSIPPPTWARALDLLCFLLVALSVVVAEWGGFRERVGGLRVALTSPYRLLIAAGILAAVRHALVPASPIYRDLPARLLAGWRAEPARSAWSALVGTRLAILFVGYLAVVMFGYRTGTPPLRVSSNEVANLQARWDMAWYFGIATGGYRVLSNNPRDQQNIVFFPAYPMLMRVAGRLLGGETSAFVIGGTLVSLGAFFWGLTYLFRLAREMLGDADRAGFAVWLIAVYPFAWFFSAIYTESLFLAGAVGAFYHFRRGEWTKAGAWGVLVGLTRPNGCFLSIPLGIIAITPWLPCWIAGGATRSGADAEGRDRKRLLTALCTAAMPGVGMLLYSAYIWHLTGAPFAWAEGHAAWGREYRGLGVLVSDRYAWLVNSGVYAYSSQVPGDLVNALGALFALAAVWPVSRRFGIAYGVFILVNILPPMAAGGMLSVGRFSSVLFPAFLWYATVVPERHRPGWLASFMAMQAFGAALFYTWHELY
jgi:hypothetical protein